MHWERLSLTDPTPGSTCLSIAGSCGEIHSNGKMIVDEFAFRDSVLPPDQIAQDAAKRKTLFRSSFYEWGAGFTSVPDSKVSLGGGDGTTGPDPGRKRVDARAISRSRNEPGGVLTPGICRATSGGSAIPSSSILTP